MKGVKIIPKFVHFQAFFFFIIAATFNVFSIYYDQVAVCIIVALIIKFSECMKIIQLRAYLLTYLPAPGHSLILGDEFGPPAGFL